MPSAKSKIVTLAIGDMHHPFAHPDTLPFLQAIRKKYKPTDIVCMGDEVDQASLSQYDKDPDGLSPGAELALAIERLQPFYKEFPVLKVCESNHTVRVYKQAFRAGIPEAFLKSYREWLQAPKGWQWSARWEVGGVLFEHGEPGTGPLAAVKAAQSNMQSTVIGHVHSYAGISQVANFRDKVFGMNVGCLIGVDAYAFKYMKLNRSKPILAAGIIDDGEPQLIHMKLDKHQRWVGKL